MKTLKLAVLALLAVVMAACATGSGADSVASKLDKGEVLTQADYGIIIDYMGQFADKAQTIQDKIDLLPTDAPQVSALETELNLLRDKYPHLQAFTAALDSATPEEVGTENVKRIDALAPRIWFDAPKWANATQDPSVAGFVETVAPAEADPAIVAAPQLDEKVGKK